jgi:hypothetical protein
VYLALSFFGCVSTPAPPAVLEDGKSIWRRVESEHFTVESNSTDDAQAKQMASEFETLWYAFASVPILGLRPPSKKPLVVVLSHSNEYRYLAGDKTAGMFIQDSLLGPLILLPPNTGPFRVTVVKHELAHLIASGALKNAPEWLHEGLAQVMETASFDTQKGKILFGEFSLDLVYGASFRTPADLFMSAWPKNLDKEEMGRYYGRSWLLVHFLIDDELQAFLNFIVRLRNGEDWRTAWEREILVSRSEIDGALDRYYARAKFGLWTVSAHLPDTRPLQPSTVPPADALALRSLLQAYSLNPARTQQENLQAADADLQAANEIDPASARVRTILTATNKPARP